MTCASRNGSVATLYGLLLTAYALLFSVAACSPQPLDVTREPATLRLVAAESCATLAQESARAYETSHPWVRVTTEVLNNALAVDALQGNEADLALLSWGTMSSGEDSSLWSEPLARDGIAIIVHSGSSFSKIGLTQLRDIFSGRLQERRGMVLTVVSREAGSGTRSAFESIVLDGGDTTLNAVVMPSNEAMIDYVARTPSAIGYVSARCLDERVRVLPVEGTLPSAEELTSGRYPIWRELHLASSGDPVGEARQFAQWLLSGSSSSTDSFSLAEGM